MSCVTSRFFKQTNGNTQTELKSFAIDDKFSLQTRSFSKYQGTVATSIELGRSDARILMEQLREFINQ